MTDHSILEKINSLPPDKIEEVKDFIDFLRQRESDRKLVQDAALTAEPAFQSVWNNSDDADYDRL